MAGRPAFNKPALSRNVQWEKGFTHFSSSTLYACPLTRTHAAHDHAAEDKCEVGCKRGRGQGETAALHSPLSTPTRTHEQGGRVREEEVRGLFSLENNPSPPAPSPCQSRGTDKGARATASCCTCFSLCIRLSAVRQVLPCLPYIAGALEDGDA